jgi:hypothetical protein
MRYRLRTLLILLAVGPIFLAVSYWAVKEWQRRQAEVESRAEAMAKAQADALAEAARARNTAPPLP